MVEHVAEDHGGTFAALLGLGRSRTGLTEIQSALLEQLHAGNSDSDVAQRLGGRSVSTVRNHRFQLRKRRNEARVFLAIMQLLEEQNERQSESVVFPDTLTVSGEHARISRLEAARLRRKYFAPGEALVLRELPRKEKPKLVLLHTITELFSSERTYDEDQVNAILRPVYEDCDALRRELVDYGFLLRQRDGSAYWRG